MPQRHGWAGSIGHTLANVMFFGKPGSLLPIHPLLFRLLPVQENFLLKFQVKNSNYYNYHSYLLLAMRLFTSPSLAAQGMKLSSEEFNAIFAFYDKVGGWWERRTWGTPI